ncbi:MAG: PKD domain-containing protein, partial [Thermoplasmata archaeon]|nr:PKD domain-containing protein [Thermoplasmata archaeon]
MSGHDLYVTATNLTVQYGDPVTFAGTYPNGTVGTDYWWSFGDGSYFNGTLSTVTHTYPSPGMYPVYCQASTSGSPRDDNAPAILTILVRDSYKNDANLSHAHVGGAVLVQGVPVDDVTPIAKADDHVILEGTVLNAPSDPYYRMGTPTFQLLSVSNPYVTLTSQGSGNRWTANLTATTGNSGVVHVRFSAPSTPVPGHTGRTLYGNFTFTIINDPGFASLPSRLPTSPHHGTLRVAEGFGGGPTIDPALAYDTIDEETIANVYEQLITYNGSTVGGGSGDFAPALATCVPGSALCTTLYASSLVSGWNYTFVVSGSARFYDPFTGANWSVYPSDVVFSIARTLAFSDLPSAAVNNGWILAQTLLPGRASSANQSNGGWDGGIHAPYNTTPQMIFAAMTVNDSSCPTVSGRFVGDGCVTFHAHGNDLTWPFFLSALASPLGASIVPAGWFSAGTQAAGLPYWTESNVSGTGDGPVAMISASSVAKIAPTYWDTFESTGSSPPYWGNVQFAAAGSGPYYLASYSAGRSYSLRANPTFAPNANCVTPGCPPTGNYIGTVDVNFTGTGATSVAAVANGSADIAPVDALNVTAQASLFDRGGAQLLEQPSSGISFAPFQLLFNVTNAKSLVGVGNSITIPGNWFTYLGMRHLFTAAFPYATEQAGNRTAHGFGLAANYGGAI